MPRPLQSRFCSTRDFAPAAIHKAVASLLAMHLVRPGTLPRETSAKFSALNTPARVGAAPLVSD